MRRIAVFGASGFVGARLCERLASEGNDEVVPIIHSNGNAWRLSRRGFQLKFANLLEKSSVASAVEGCTHVVNCSRGDDRVMMKGLENLLEICTDAKVSAFVHLSSVLVYGDPPMATSVSESAGAPKLTGYGAIKARQDARVKRAAASLPSLILCPPNITGPYSPFLLNLIGAIRGNAFALMDGGEAPCVVVDIDNLVHAIEVGMNKASSAAQRLFVTDDEPVTWSMVIRPLAELAGVSHVPNIDEHQLRALRARVIEKPSYSPIRSLKHLMSSEVRGALRQDPLLAQLDVALRKVPTMLGAGVEDRLRSSIGGPPPIPRPRSASLNVLLSGQQLRGVRHLSTEAKRAIGYRPPRSFSESMRAFELWYRAHHGMNSAFWPLLSRLS